MVKLINDRKTEVDIMARQMSQYVLSHPNAITWPREQLIEETVRFMANDIGAAQNFLDVIGVDVDLYALDDPEVKKKDDLIVKGFVAFLFLILIMIIAQLIRVML